MASTSDRSSWTTPFSSSTASSGTAPTSAHIAGLEFLDRDVNESKVGENRSCGRNIRRLRLHVLPVKRPQQLSPQSPNVIFHHPRLGGVKSTT